MSSPEQAAAASTTPRNIQIHLGLGPHATKDQKALAQQVGHIMVASLMKSGFDQVSQQVTLNLYLQTCDVGSACGRFFCSKLGVGWAHLGCQWSLDEQVGPEAVEVYQSPTHELKDAGTVGCADLCGSDNGETALKSTLAPQMASHIWTTIQTPLKVIQKKQQERERQ